MKLTRVSHSIPARRWRWKSAPGSRVAPRAKRADRSADPIRHFMHDGLDGLAQDSVVLGIGCEGAFLAPQLAEYSADVTVLDSSASEIAQIARRFPEIAFRQHQPASPLPFPRESFDAIWCCEFLDRVFDPAAVLREMHRVLVPGGRLLATVPDRGPLQKVLLALFTPDATARPNPPVHHFTKSALVRMVRDAGFTEVRISIAWPGGNPAGTASRRLLLQAKKRAAARLGPLETLRARAAREKAGAEGLALASRLRPAA